MNNLLVYIIFILSAAFAAAGIVLSTRLRNRYKAEYFTALLYFQVFIFTFGFYGIWGQVVIKAFLEGIVTPELLERFTNVSALLGLPFLVFAWLMLTRFSREVSGREKSNWYIFWFLLVNFILLFGLGFFMTRTGDANPEMIIKYYFICLNIIYTTVSALYIIFPGHHKTLIHKYEGWIFSFSIIIIMVLQCIALVFYNGEPLKGMIFIFLFFAGNCFMPLYFTYGMVLSMFMQDPARDISFEEFCRVFDVTPRESEIIREICNGLSNKEISDRLFITLQTVKDHTHRIYIKTNVKSRVQLINLVKDTTHSPDKPWLHPIGGLTHNN
jgi:DNA-binding CsgD family transcriptional regulator